ncbi:MAG: pantoate--beta-alanine ligase [Bacteriovoracaceae bacterium]
MLTLITTTLELKKYQEQSKLTSGFVPTMGSLHEGHLSLLKAALQDYDHVYFSIFVNPTQFGPNEDFDKYPRDLKKDLSLIENFLKDYPTKKVVVFAPETIEEIYPTHFKSKIVVEGLNKILEGQMRPTHFDGVTTVVYLLFSVVKPETAYFGLKDFQQFTIIKRMVHDLHLPVKLAGIPIKREASGLAMSSRNQYLSDEQKKAALILVNTLTEIKTIINSQKSNLKLAQDYISQKLQDKNWDYLTIRETETLSENLEGHRSLVLLAVYRQGSTRLLDNMQVELQ